MSFNKTIARINVNDLNWTWSVSIWTDKKLLYFNSYQKPVEDENLNNLIKALLFHVTSDQPTCSHNKFDIYEGFCKIEPLKIIKSRSNTVAVNQEKRKLVGDTVYLATSGISFDFW